MWSQGANWTSAACRQAGGKENGIFRRGKTAAEIKAALKASIQPFNLKSPAKWKSCGMREKLNRKARIAWRVNPSSGGN